MGSCTGKPVNKNRKSSPKYQENTQQPSSQLPNTSAQVASPLNNKSQDNNDAHSAFFPTIKQQQNPTKEAIESVDPALHPVEAEMEKEDHKIEPHKAQNIMEHQEDEEEKIDVVKHKGTLFSMDQQSTQFTSALNELTSKKDYQTSETSTNNPIRQKKPTKINTYEQGFVVQIFEPTQNSMEEAFSINEVDEEVEEEESQENLTDENEENIVQKNQHFQKINIDHAQFKLFNVVSQRNPNDVASQLSISRLSHSAIQNEHNE